MVSYTLSGPQSRTLSPTARLQNLNKSQLIPGSLSLDLHVANVFDLWLNQDTLLSHLIKYDLHVSLIIVALQRASRPIMVAGVKRSDKVREPRHDGEGSKDYEDE